MKVSIIMPVYNARKFLYSSLTSLLEQRYPDTEIIIVDDSSTDDSYSIAKTFGSKSVKILQQKNAGAAVARNTGLAHATGDYIQFMDVDDFLSVDKIEKQVIALEAQKNKVAVCNYINFVNDDELKQNIQPENQSRFIYSSDHPAEFLINLFGGKGESNFIQTNCWLVPRSVINKSGGWRNYRCPDDDGEFFTRVLLASEGIVYVPGVFNYYRRDVRDNKLSANANQKYIQNTLLTIDLKYEYLKKAAESEKLQKAFAKQYLDFAIYNYPLHKKLSMIALKRYKKMNQKAELPLLGGRATEFMKIIFGWKAAQLLRFYLR